MSDRTKKVVATVVASLVGAGLTLASSVALAKCEQMPLEKCYGIAKKGKNQCGGASNACQGSATKDGDPSSWLLVPKGTCDNIVGGSTKPAGQ